MVSSESLKLLVQDLIDGRLSAEEAARVEGLIRADPDLAQTARFYRWLNAQLPKLFEEDAAPLPPRMQALLDSLGSDATATDDRQPPAEDGAPGVVAAPKS